MFLKREWWGQRSALPFQLRLTSSIRNHWCRERRHCQRGDLRCLERVGAGKGSLSGEVGEVWFYTLREKCLHAPKGRGSVHFLATPSSLGLLLVFLLWIETWAGTGTGNISISFYSIATCRLCDIWSPSQSWGLWTTRVRTPKLSCLRSAGQGRECRMSAQSIFLFFKRH